MEQFSSWITSLGSIVGLLTGIFVLWDRLFRERPTAYLVASRAGGIGRRAVYLRVKNTRNRPILIEATGGIRPGNLVVAFDHSTRGAISSLVDSERTLVLDEGREMDLRLITPSTFDELPEATKFDVQLWWRHAQWGLLPIKLPLAVRIWKRDFVLLEKGQPMEMAFETPTGSSSSLLPGA